MSGGVDKAASIATAVVVIAGIMILVRPGSQGPSLVSNLFSGFKGIIGSATGGGTWGSTTSSGAGLTGTTQAPGTHTAGGRG